GARHVRVALRHILPNTMGPFIVLATAQLGGSILVEAALSFLGLGIPEPYPSWGRMLSIAAAEYAEKAPWLVIWPGLAISLAVFGTNLLGDALRDTAAATHLLSGERFRFGVGASHGPAHDRLGIKPGKPLDDMRKFVTEVKAYAPQVGALSPLTLATLRSRMVALAGEIAEGAVW